MVNNSNGKKITVTRDSSASVKILRSLEQQGLIEIYDVMLENGRNNKKIKNNILPIGVWNHSYWDEAIYAGDDTKYDDIREMIGNDKIEDAMQLESHIRNNFDYFVTEDTDFLNKRDELNKKFYVKIVTPKELQVICQQ